MVRMVHPENNVFRLCEENCPDHHSINLSRKTLYNTAGYCSYHKCLLNKCSNSDCKEKHNLPFGQWCCRGVSPPSPSVQSTRSLNRGFGYCSSDLSQNNVYPCHSLYDSQISVVPIVKFKRFTRKKGNFTRQSFIKIGGGVHPW